MRVHSGDGGSAIIDLKTDLLLIETIFVGGGRKNRFIYSPKSQTIAKAELDKRVEPKLSRSASLVDRQRSRLPNK